MIVRLGLFATPLAASAGIVAATWIGFACLPALGATPSGGVVAWGGDGQGNPAYVHPEALSGVVAIAAADDVTMALKEDGRVVAWGGYRRDLSAAFGGLPPLSSIACGSSALFLSRDGRIFERWRDGTDRALPFDPSGFMAVASGGGHCLALQSSGRVVCWGNNQVGQATPPEGLEDVEAIAAGYDHSVALKRDGAVVAWGGNAYGQSHVPLGLGRVVAVSAGSLFTLALREDGTVSAWGNRANGAASVPAQVTNVVAISAGNNHALALRRDGSTIAWGSGDRGKTEVPADLSGVTAIAAGGSHSVALGLPATPVIEGPPVSVAARPWQSAEFKVRATGFDLRYQWLRDGQPVPGGTTSTLRIPGTITCNAAGEYTVQVSNRAGVIISPPVTLTLVSGEPPQSVVNWGVINQRGLDVALSDGNRNFVAVAAGGWYDQSFTVALRDNGSVVAWGDNARGQTSVPSELANVRAVAAGAFHAAALKDDGRVVVWGSPESRELRPPNGLNKVAAIAAGEHFTLALKSDGSVVEWGNYIGLAHATFQTRVRIIAAGGGVGLAVAEDGSVFVRTFWMDGAFLPVVAQAPPALPDAVQIAISDSAGGAVNRDGTITVWGLPELAQDERLKGVTDAVGIAIGRATVAVLKRNGTLIFINSTGDSRWDPPHGITNVVAISAGFSSTAALGRATAPSVLSAPEIRLISEWQTESFSVDAAGFGLNYLWYHGNRALLSETNSTLVVPEVREAMSGDYDVKVSNAAGSTTHRVVSLQVKPRPEPGTVVTWGRWTVALAEGTGERALVPDRLSSVRQISASRDHDVAAMSDGSVRSWGRFFGVDVPSPGNRTGVEFVAAGRNHAVALLAEGTVTCWGSNESGQSKVPGGLSNVVSVAAGPGFSMALRSDGAVVTWGQSQPGFDRVTGELGAVKAIAACDNGLAAFLQRDGTVVVWEVNDSETPVTQTGIYDAVAIALGYEHLLAITADGQLRTWSRRWGLGSVPASSHGQTEAPAGLSDVVAVAAGGWFSLALKRDGTIVAWGQFRTLGHLDGEPPDPPAGLTGVTAIAAGESHALALVGPVANPPIRIVVGSGGTSIAWPTIAAGMRLEATQDLTFPDWRTAPGIPTVMDGWNLLPVSSSDGSHFFRLSHP